MKNLKLFKIQRALNNGIKVNQQIHSNNQIQISKQSNH